MSRLIVGSFGDALDPAVLADATRALRDVVTAHGRPRSICIGVMGDAADLERRPVLDWLFADDLTYRQTFRERHDWEHVARQLGDGLLAQLNEAGVDDVELSGRRGRRGRCRARR